MTLNQLRAFVVAVQLGSFTSAASQLKMAQASVSELVRRMEEELGLALFVRGPRRLVLTNAGTELLPYAERALASVDEGRQILASISSLMGGMVSFGLLRNWAHYGLVDLPGVFSAEFPEVRLRLVGLSSTEVASGVRDGELEAGIIVLPVEDEGLIVTPLIRDELLYASRDAERVAEPMTMEKLSKAALTLYGARWGWSAPTRRQLAERAQLEGFKLYPHVEVEHVEAALRLVAQGIGDTVIPRAIAVSSSCPPEVKTVPFKDRLYDTIAFIQRPSATLSPGAREFARRARSMVLSAAAPEDRIYRPNAKGQDRTRL